MNELLHFFRHHQRFVLTTHVNPDGDAIGCEMALAGWLQAQGKTVAILNCSPTPFIYRFLDPEGIIRVFEPQTHTQTLQSADAIVVLDTNHLNRVMSMEPFVRQSPAPKICIDHHLDPEAFADITLFNPDATSTGEILYDLFRTADRGMLSRPVAEALYVAVMTDTGSFRYPRVNAETHRRIAQLIECGADPVELYSQVYNRWSPGRLRLLGEMLSHLETAYEGQVAFATITQDMLRRTGTLEEDTDNFTTYIMSMDGVAAGIFFLELNPGCKVSFRSHGDIPINKLAQEFGGNGHKNAAGARFAGGVLSEIRTSIIEAAAKYLNNGR